MVMSFELESLEDCSGIRLSSFAPWCLRLEIPLTTNLVTLKCYRRNIFDIELSSWIQCERRTDIILSTTKNAGMPGTVGEGGQPAKRKRTNSDKRPSKRAKSESSDEEGAQAQILLLENEIFESKKNYNNIAILIKILREDEHALNAALSLWRIFTKLMVAKDMTLKPETVQKEAVVVRWLKERYSEYKTGLLDLLGEEGIGSTALEFCMRLLKTEGLHLRSSSEYNFPTGFLTDIVRVALKPESDGIVRKEFSEKFVEEYDDIRFYTFEAIE
jgi:U3 small nucleolar RNA-associated protein 19